MVGSQEAVGEELRFRGASHPVIMELNRLENQLKGVIIFVFLYWSLSPSQLGEQNQPFIASLLIILESFHVSCPLIHGERP